jgi:hypothetical protein
MRWNSLSVQIVAALRLRASVVGNGGGDHLEGSVSRLSVVE